ncbi:type I Zorya anti-phage system protein ZorD [Pseudomonas songnenensis]|uniref:DEAD/DEAH box helicase n=1 Tax=Pseudomonas songnenensis TaxID=1176259 RepID=A0A482TYR1_9PSED|nr:type I Zorya anti-phage system protein ZorD [Pseudomonas songnenensis]RYJ59212.1 DEAD/DEAH box helicase [Pseudomonas songnenensis]
MLGRFFSGKDRSQSAKGAASGAYQIEEQGICYALSLADDDTSWPVAAYLDQLFEEDYASQLSDRWLLPWESIYQLLDDPEHASSLPLLGLPAIAKLQPQLASTGGLSDPDFKVFVQSWRNSETGSPVTFERVGAMARHAATTELLPRAVWELLKAIRDLHAAQQQVPGEVTNQIGWANIRKLAKRAGAVLDGFLDKTVVVRPEHLKLRPRKAVVSGTPIIELDVAFDGQPDNWLASFDGYKQVQDKYRVPGADGSVTHVLIEPDVKAVLESVRSLPGRRVAGDEALSLVRNPYSVIGDAAEKVVDADEYEEQLADAGIYFHRFRLEPCLGEDGKHIRSIGLFLEPISAKPLPEVELRFDFAHEFAPFVNELQVKLAAGMPAGFWQGYELELSDFDLAQLAGVNELLRHWQRQEAGQTFEEVLDLASYGDRVVGIGEAERITSPFLVKEATENWLPVDVKELGVDGDLLSQWDPASREDFEEFEHRIDQARVAGDEQVCLPGTETPLPFQVAEQLYEAWSKKLNPVEPKSPVVTEPVAGRAVLHIEHNIEEATYAQRREAALLAGRHANADIPELLRPEVQLRDHQMKGVAWMQHLFGLSPDHVAGCLLADDMGLGKTIQLLTFVVWYLEQNPQGKPVLIVAPVSLLDNWERELQRFFYADALPVLKLYGGALSAVKFKRDEIPEDLRAKGIKNLLRPGWMGDARIVLTTYETLRDQELSLARQQWAIVICDEAQKIKNPAALITQAAKAIPSRFRIACTGTPVENTLIDLWCLFDFIQPGFLGGLNQFGREYQRPIEAGLERDTAALERLRGLIEPQTLRRTKQDVAKDLPAKIEDQECRKLQMHSLQRNLYLSEVAQYTQKQQMQEQLEQRESGMLGLLHKLKLVCAHPFSVQPDPRLREHSPKLQWLLSTLDNIARLGSGDKVILFTELRDVQRELQHAIQERFGFKPTVINGDTSTSSQSAQSRQRLIDHFQEQPGFSVIILSTVAVGFGVNVQAANHVIHFTRCWNPAKEDQATDRAYRIGQEKDVYVYYPTVRDARIPTFEATLDELLQKRRALARDMLQGASELQASEFGELLRAQG